MNGLLLGVHNHSTILNTPNNSHWSFITDYEHFIPTIDR